MVCLVDPFLGFPWHDKNYQNSRVDGVNAQVVIVLNRQWKVDVTLFDNVSGSRLGLKLYLEDALSEIGNQSLPSTLSRSTFGSVT